MNSKISNNFHDIFSQSSKDSRCPAIVIYKKDKKQDTGLESYQPAISVKSLDVYKKATENMFSTPLTMQSVSNQLPAAEVEVTKDSIDILASQDDVVAILPNQKVQLIQPKKVDYSELHKNEKISGYTWGLEQLQIPQVWQEAPKKGEGVRVAVLDTGVYADHPALRGKVKDFVVIDSQGRYIKAQPYFDAGQHGTHVCGTIAGGKYQNQPAIGVAPNAELVVAAVLVGDSTLSTIIKGISWAVERGAFIINMSLGFSYYEPLFDLVLQQLIHDYDVLPVIAIGNENHGNTSCPGNVKHAFSIGAAEKTEGSKNEIAFFSSGASLEFYDANGNRNTITKPDVAAPGVQVYSCIPPQQLSQGVLEYTYMDGTSMATPHVAGVAALLKSAVSTASAVDIVSALKTTAQHPNNNKPDNRWGNGMINPLAALKALQNTTTNPTSGETPTP